MATRNPNKGSGHRNGRSLTCHISTEGPAVVTGCQPVGGTLTMISRGRVYVTRLACLPSPAPIGAEVTR